MYKNQLQELAQRSCFNLPTYTCSREGPDHAPRFKVKVNFNGEIFESPSFCSTIRQAEYSAAEVALDALVNRGPSFSLATKILDETGVYKNLLQDVSQRLGSSLPVYTTCRSGLGHLPVFTCVVEFAAVRFTGQPAKNKKQAEKNAAMAAWTSLKKLPQQPQGSEPEHVTVARALSIYLRNAKTAGIKFPIIFPTQSTQPSSTQEVPTESSKILPLICPNSSNNNFMNKDKLKKPIFRRPSSFPKPPQQLSIGGTQRNQQPQNFPVTRTAPYIPFHLMSTTHRGIMPPVTVKNAIPVYGAPPPKPVRNAIPVYAPPSKPRWTAHTDAATPPGFFSRLPPVYAAPPVQVVQNHHPVRNGNRMIGTDEGKKKETGA